VHWLRHIQERLSDRVHAGGDAFAEQAGWATTKTTGRFGFGTRTYRDPRFGQPKTGKSPAVPTQAVADAINTGQLRGERVDGCGFWPAKATRQHLQAAAETGHGTVGREQETWASAAGHARGLPTVSAADRAP
jgi:hypothetical protein